VKSDGTNQYRTAGTARLVAGWGDGSNLT